MSRNLKRNDDGRFAYNRESKTAEVDKQIVRYSGGKDPRELDAIKRENTSRIIAGLLKQQEISLKADIEDIQTLYNCFREYLEYQTENGLAVTNSGAYASCGLSRDMIHKWQVGYTRNSQPEYKEFANFVVSVCNGYREAAMANGELNPIIGIWWQKVYEGYRDNEPVQQTSAPLLGEDNEDEIHLSIGLYKVAYARHQKFGKA